MSGASLGPGGEFDLIRSVLAGAGEPGAGVVVGPGDDALVLAGGVVVSCDLSVEGVHFDRSWLSLEEIGYRATAAAVSDLAAMAAAADGILLAVAAPGPDGRRVVTEVARGARDAVEALDGALLGGDVSVSPGPLVVDVVALGRAEEPVTRAGSRAGDLLWVTGRLGAAAGAADAWIAGREPAEALREAFARPAPRIPEALWLSERCDLHALIDVSDGVAGDAGHLAAAGGVGVEIDLDSVPVHPALDGNGDGGRPGVESALETALTGGEDYELLFTAAEGDVEALREEFEERFGLPLTAVGRVVPGDGVRFVRDGAEVSLKGSAHDHFPMDDSSGAP